MKIPRPGSPALVNTFHRETNIRAASAKNTTIRTITSHPKTAQRIVLIHIIASGLMFPVNAAH
jgi:hypothetical protein